MPFLQNWLWFVNVLVVSVLPSSPPARFSLSDWSKSFIRISCILAGVWTVSRINESFSYSTLHDIKSMREWYYTLVHTHTNLDNITVVGSCLFFLTLFIHVWLKLFEIIVLLVLSIFFFTFARLLFYFPSRRDDNRKVYFIRRKKREKNYMSSARPSIGVRRALPHRVSIRAYLFIYFCFIGTHVSVVCFSFCGVQMRVCVCLNERFNHFLCCCFICLHNKINMHRPINWNV